MKSYALRKPDDGGASLLAQRKPGANQSLNSQAVKHKGKSHLA
jgi:hypothetical protein